MADNKINMPSGTGGLVSYYNESYKAKINLKPSHVIIFIVSIIGLRIIFPLIFNIS